MYYGTERAEALKRTRFMNCHHNERVSNWRCESNPAGSLCSVLIFCTKYTDLCQQQMAAE